MPVVDAGTNRAQLVRRNHREGKAVRERALDAYHMSSFHAFGHHERGPSLAPSAACHLEPGEEALRAEPDDSVPARLKVEPRQSFSGGEVLEMDGDVPPSDLRLSPVEVSGFVENACHGRGVVSRIRGNDAITDRRA